MKLIKALFSFIVFLVIGAAFFALIRFEIQYGVAGGKFGGAEVNDSPGTFWFFIEGQALLAMYSIVYAVTELWNFSQRNIQESDRKIPETIVAIYWLLATFFFLVLNALAIWAGIEMLFNGYNLLAVFEMPKKAILEGLLLVCFGVFGSLLYRFLFMSLIETFFPKARISFQLFDKKK